MIKIFTEINTLFSLTSKCLSSKQRIPKKCIYSSIHNMFFGQAHSTHIVECM